VDISYRPPSASSARQRVGCSPPSRANTITTALEGRTSPADHFNEQRRRRWISRIIPLCPQVQLPRLGCYDTYSHGQRSPTSRLAPTKEDAGNAGDRGHVLNYWTGIEIRQLDIRKSGLLVLCMTPFCCCVQPPIRFSEPVPPTPPPHFLQTG